jgi:ATP-binding cassette, subfamily A (ABC1), member 3
LSFASNLKAVLIKRANIYKRNRKSFLYESLIPALIILCGVAISKFSERFQRSPPKLVSASLLPPKQKLLINRTPVNAFDSDILPELLVANLPLNAFDVTYDENKRVSTDSYDVFGQAVYQFGSSKASEQPYLYSSFEVFQANKAKQNYKFVSHVNATAQDIVMIAPQIMYESILKTALDDPSFEFKVTSKAYPLTHQVASYVQGTNAAFLVFCTAIAYSIILTNIMSTVVVERISNLKHVQYISGMRLSAYWIANFIFDFFKMQITIVVTLLVLWGFGTGLRSSMIAYVLLPFATLPFTYCMSFIFTVDSAAQTFTMFFNFIVMLICSIAVYALQFVR